MATSANRAEGGSILNEGGETGTAMATKDPQYQLKSYIPRWRETLHRCRFWATVADGLNLYVTVVAMGCRKLAYSHGGDGGVCFIGIGRYCRLV